MTSVGVLLLLLVSAALSITQDLYPRDDTVLEDTTIVITQSGVTLGGHGQYPRSPTIR